AVAGAQQRDLVVDGGHGGLDRLGVLAVAEVVVVGVAVHAVRVEQRGTLRVHRVRLDPGGGQGGGDAGGVGGGPHRRLGQQFGDQGGQLGGGVALRHAGHVRVSPAPHQDDRQPAPRQVQQPSGGGHRHGVLAARHDVAVHHEHLVRRAP